MPVVVPTQPLKIFRVGKVEIYHEIYTNGDDELGYQINQVSFVSEAVIRVIRTTQVVHMKDAGNTWDERVAFTVYCSMNCRGDVATPATGHSLVSSLML